MAQTRKSYLKNNLFDLEVKGQGDIWYVGA
jgi:hypothetical protein